MTPGVAGHPALAGRRRIRAWSAAGARRGCGCGQWVPISMARFFPG